MGLFFNFSKEKNPNFDRRIAMDNDKINSLLKDIPSFRDGGILDRIGISSGPFTRFEDLKKYKMGGTLSGDDRMKMVPFYQSGGIISGETIIPSTVLSPLNQTGNIVRPNGIIINRSQQAIRNQKMI